MMTGSMEKTKEFWLVSPLLYTVLSPPFTKFATITLFSVGELLGKSFNLVTILHCLEWKWRNGSNVKNTLIANFVNMYQKERKQSARRNPNPGPTDPHYSEDMRGFIPLRYRGNPYLNFFFLSLQTLDSVKQILNSVKLVRMRSEQKRMSTAHGTEHNHTSRFEDLSLSRD